MGEEDNGSVALAAGAAAVTAEQAKEDAAEAEATADTAVIIAEGASDTARDALGEAWSAQDAVAELRDEMLTGFDEIRALLDKPGKGNGGEDPDAVPAPERKEEDPAAAKPATEDKPAPSYGSKTWFGGGKNKD